MLSHQSPVATKAPAVILNANGDQLPHVIPPAVMALQPMDLLLGSSRLAVV